ncbi:MAG TPA: CsiV family protein [Steroidobacteraceae bacterium]
MKFRSAALAVFVAATAWLPAASQQPAPATVPAYHIEIIIFRATAAQGGTENWAAEAGTRNFSNDSSADEAGASDTREVGRFLKVLPADQFQLADIEKRLRASAGYAPLAHVAWSQTASAWGTRAGFPLPRLGVDVPGLSGTVVLERGQFLHLGMTLAYAPANPPAGLGAAPGTTFTLNEGRRVRFNERAYFDHPAFGVIAVVTPVAGTRPKSR